MRGKDAYQQYRELQVENARLREALERVLRIRERWVTKRMSADEAMYCVAEALNTFAALSEGESDG